MTRPDKRWDLDLAYGKVGEQMVRELLTGRMTVEVKRDDLVSDTGNIAIEYSFKGSPSGIMATKADFWAIILSGQLYQDDFIIFIRTERLRSIVRMYHLRGSWVQGGDRSDSLMVLIPVKELLI